MAPLQTTPPSHKNPKRVLRRPPILEDYINVTSTEGTRVFMAVREDPSRTGVEVRGVWRPGILSSAAFCDLHLAQEQSFDEASILSITVSITAPSASHSSPTPWAGTHAGRSTCWGSPSPT